MIFHPTIYLLMVIIFSFSLGYDSWSILQYSRDKKPLQPRGAISYPRVVAASPRAGITPLGRKKALFTKAGNEKIVRQFIKYLLSN